jgi:hypothetical protein
MIAWVIVSIILAIIVLALLYQLNKKTKEKENIEKQERRSWMLKIALEQSCELPTVEPQELEKIEPQLDQLMDAAEKDASAEEKIRQLIMSLYQEKAKARAPKEAPKKEAPAKDANPPRRPPVTGRG